MLTKGDTMTTKHKPATPLPFSRLEAFRVGMLRYDQLTDADRAEVERRANAYPRLVERAATLRSMLGWIAEHVSAADPLIYEAAIKEFGATDALLRELGEAE